MPMHYATSLDIKYQAAMKNMSLEQRLLYHILLFAAALLLSVSTLLCAQPFYDSSSPAKLSTSWINRPSIVANTTELNTLTPILIRVTGGSTFVCGFYCNGNGPGPNADPDITRSKDCVFGVLISTDGNHAFMDSSDILSTQLVWSANRNDPVQVNATLRLSEDGDLILSNSDGTLVWSSHTGGKSVAGMNLTEAGNLVLFGQNNEPIWQSFDYPTDSILVGQKLMRGQRLTSSVSASNWSEGIYFLSIDDEGLSAYIKSDPPQIYFYGLVDVNLTQAEFTNGSFLSITISSSAQFIKLGPDGHFKVFQWGQNDFTPVADLLPSRDCDYPMFCGKYGVCSDGQCSCLEMTSGDQGNFFRQTNYRQPNLGCSLVTPISCDHFKDHSLLELNNTSYFAFQPLVEDTYKEDTLVEDCKNQCLNNCSCKAALFAKDPTGSHSRNGSCLLLNEVFSIAINDNQKVTPYHTTLYIKVQVQQHPSAKASSSRQKVILASSLSAIFGVLSVIGCCLVLFMKRNKQWNETEEDFLNDVPGMPIRYSYENLKAATEDFSKKLGEGGFGSVYEGALSDDGTKVAVKCLDGFGKVKDSFLVEVKTIGGIHHVNLVKLIGFCYEKSHRLLVYEYMANRSLDGWIFNGEQNHCLPWQARRRIISDIAKGLAYLHEDCSQKIIHLDIKPQNILLDHNFNAKISDFGLSKLIEKDQSRVITTMRGTPGYLAPEWLSSAITEKVDVYSFGIVMLEIICGRKNVDWSKSDEDKHLLSVFKRKAEEEKLEELVDERSEDMLNHSEEVVEMMGIAAWCLQSDFTKRPSMSIVVKVLEGLVAAETDLDYDFLNPTIVTKRTAGAAYDATKLLPSALSGPR